MLHTNVLIALALINLTLCWKTLPPTASTVLSRKHGEEAGEQCEPQGQDFFPTLSHWPTFTRIEDLVQGPGLDRVRDPSNRQKQTASSSKNENEAICVFEQNKLALHFPHEMQQLYRCVSFWLHASSPNDHQEPPHRVLEIFRPEDKNWLEAVRFKIYKQRNRNNPYHQGFYHHLRAALNVTVRTGRVDAATSTLSSVQPVVWKNFRMLPGDSVVLRDAFLRVADAAGATVTSTNTTVTPPACSARVRIAILNRRKKRSIRNVQTLRHAIERHTKIPTTIMYFEGKSFDEQVDFMARTDILISPHGAQLTGLPFMADCGGVLEIFPPRFWDPEYYGSLAASSGLAYVHVSLGNFTSDSGDNMSFQEVKQSMEHQNKHQRRKNREVGLCPAPPTIVQGLDLLLEAWQKCCHYQKTIRRS